MKSVEAICFSFIRTVSLLLATLTLTSCILALSQDHTVVSVINETVEDIRVGPMLSLIRHTVDQGHARNLTLPSDTYIVAKGITTKYVYDERRFSGDIANWIRW